MSGIKQEVQWSPVHHNEFITWGSEIYLYKTVPTEKASGHHLDLNHSTSAQLLATNSSHQYLKCIDIYPKYEKDTLLAVGQANGKVALATFGSTVFDSKGLAGLEFVPKHSRQCNALMWNSFEHGLLAAGLDKYRSDHGVLVWDVNLSECQSPLVEIGLSDSAHSLTWLPSNSSSLAVGFNNKSIKLIDIRDSSKTVNSCQTKAVYGLTVCPDNSRLLASYFEHQLAIWDLRNFEKPLITVQKSKQISKISWCPTRKNLLGCLLKESCSLHVVDVQSQSEEREDASVIERIVKPGLPHVISSFSWHPSNQNRLLAVSVHGGFMDYSVSERMTLSWSNSSTITWTSDSKNLKMIDHQDDFYEAIGDLTLTIKKRVSNNYGFLQSLKDNSDLVQDEVVKNLWIWLEHSQNLVEDGTIDSYETKHPGIRSILGIETGSNSSVQFTSEAQFLPWSSLNTTSTAKVYRSEIRDKALKLCNWDFVFDSTLLMQAIEELISKGKITKAAAYCVFGLKLKNAIQVLSGDPAYSTVAMALSGFTDDKSSVWKESCTHSRSQLSDPYLRMIFSFLTSDAETYDPVFVEEDVDVADMVGFALTFLSDSYLIDYIEQLTESLVRRGNLEGILLTGTSVEVVPLFQQYINITSDIQTPSLVSMRTFTKELLENDRVKYWISCYRELLDTLMLWEARAEFDIWLKGRESSKPDPQVFVSCNFCGKSTVSGPSAVRNKSHYPRYTVSSNHTKVSCCPHCRKPQPRCAICLVHMGTGSTFSEMAMDRSQGGALANPFSSWYTWCQTCRHGGHVSHMTSWFSEHKECPVTACSCKCMSLDPIVALSSQT